ncbi:glycoside hydrolase [Flavobacterium rivuli WB 3.3-2 = DSM 21788]|uniref:Glycoside hydrolase n=1 Tax=Flavobacterium rivuli WB 3.3-2 = DSM 21788 TaxID=1121895 RepID=A0A0A2LYJ1_9FLAO|nr:glycoside hydrolase family 88 protein [Flavobacterium rivuli]KGO85457.1 glycoside hydrolase [Flavobacterium rivuli WB 3.3-2 = DSM 21788]
MKKHHYLFFLAACIAASCSSKKDAGFTAKIDNTLKASANQYEYLGTRNPDGRFPKSYHVKNDSLETSDSGWWCSGFYPGTLLYLNEANANQALKKLADKSLADLKKEQFNKTTHDLGFMMYCSYGNAERLRPNADYKLVLMNSAKSLATRYNAVAKCIQSWDSAPWNHATKDEMPVIIDNMMNLELLFWASKHSGDKTFYDIAVNHANTTMKNHFRPDYSSYHEVVYDKNTGAVVRQITNQGAADASAWARGQAWGLYGYVVMYRETKDRKYLEQAQNIAGFILNHPNLPADKIPYWDFNAPGIPNALRDSSAAAIMASALIELGSYSDKELSKKYYADANTMLTSLMAPEYFAAPNTNGGFLLKHGVGNMPNKTEVDTPLSYGDYYFIEALMRYKQAGL